MGLHGLTATGPNRTQIAGDADPHYVQTLDAHASEMGYGNSGGLDGMSPNACRVNGARSCAAGWGVRQVDYCRLWARAHALGEGASVLSRKDKTDKAILLGDVRCCLWGGPDSHRAWGATDQG
eukprot:586683-Rhodomonas_salina.1